MAQGLRTNLYVTKQKIANIDNYYGPYQNLNSAIQNILSDTSGLYVKNGYTFGIETNGVVADYAFKNITSATTRNDIFNDSPEYNNYVEKKVSNTKVVLKDTDGQTIGQFTLNQAANGDIEITIPSQVTVDQVYNAVSQNAQSGTAVAGAISEKANTNDVMQRVTGHTNEIPTLTSTGTLQGSGKTMANVVFFDDVN